MRTIPLTKGFEALVDDADYAELRAYKWFTIMGTTKIPMPKAIRHIPGSNNGHLLMAHHLMEPGAGMRVKFLDGNTLNHQRFNLLICTPAEIQLGKRGRGGKSRFKGVWWKTDVNKWVAEIRVNGQAYKLGSYPTELAAARAYDQAAIEFHGQFARLNFPRSPIEATAIFEGPGYDKRQA